MTELANKKFREYYEGLPLSERVRVRDLFLEKSGLRYPSWYSKFKGSQFTKLELSALSEICGVDFGLLN